MIYRRLSATGDYTFGRNNLNFYTNQPEAVAQAIQTRLKLNRGDWFLDTTAGTPYNLSILGANKLNSYAPAIKSVILDTPGVKSIVSYSSYVNLITRAATVYCVVDTIYGTVTLTV